MSSTGTYLPLGEGLLTMDFTGTLNDQMKGFYSSDTVHDLVVPGFQQLRTLDSLTGDDVSLICSPDKLQDN